MPCQAGARRVLDEVYDGPWGQYLDNPGCFNPSSTLDGTDIPGPHARGEADDFGIRVPFRGSNSKGQELFLLLYKYRWALGFVQLIYNYQIWTASRDNEGIRRYNANPHGDHIHAQFTPAAARNPNLSFNKIVGTAPTAPKPPPEKEDDDMPRPERFIAYGNNWHYLGPTRDHPIEILPVDGAGVELYVKAGLVERQPSPESQRVSVSKGEINHLIVRFGDPAIIKPYP